MASSAALPLQQQLESQPAHLPCSLIVEYRKGQTIYDQHRRSTSLYLVVEGSVKVSRIAEDGREAIIEMYQPDEFFGESAFLNLDQCSEQATAHSNTKLMAWTTSALEEIAMQSPCVAMALSQILVRRIVSLTERLESFNMESIARRLARSLIRFSERQGTPEEHGWVRMPPLTHELLGQYVGTHREIVSVYMSQFRRQGFLQYSRKIILVHPESFRTWLGQKPVSSDGRTRKRAAKTPRVSPRAISSTP